MSFDPALGLHVLRSRCGARSRIGEHCRTLTAGLQGAIHATRQAVPRRAGRSKPFSIDSELHVGRKALDAMDPNSGERRIEQQLYLTYGPAGSLRATPLWAQLVAFQVPLFDQRTRRGWGHIDLLALDATGCPIVIELKRESSSESPLRAVVEAVANAIAVVESWPAMSEEIRAMCARRGLSARVSDGASPAAVVVLAPAEYWARWGLAGPLGRVVDPDARAEFRKLGDALFAAGHPVRPAAFDWPFADDARIRAAEVNW